MSASLTPSESLRRLARWSDPDFLSRAWREANGEWMEPSPQALCAFIEALAKEVEG